MFHTLGKLLINLICPVICIIVDVIINRKKGKLYDLKYISLKWLVLWVIGVGALITGLMQALNPEYTANLLQIEANDFIIIKELGYSQIGMGILGLLSIKSSYYKKASAIVYGLFIFGCTLNHFTRISIVSAGEIVSIVSDIWIVAVSLGEVILNAKE